MSTAKDYRITIRMSPEMGAWLEEQAALREIDVTSYVRMRLAEIKNGRVQADLFKGHSRAVAPSVSSPTGRPVNGDDFRAFTTSVLDAPQTDQLPNQAPLEQVEGYVALGAEAIEPDQPPPVDVNALVYQTLAEADAKGLTRQRQQDEDDLDDDHIPGLPRTVTPRGNWQEGGFRKTKEWANR